MNIIFIAPPGAGKGTQAELICEKYNFDRISTGALIREAINKKDEKAEELKNLIEQGILVNDDFVLDLIEEKIVKVNNYIFDGFPRNLNQAHLIDNLLNKFEKSIDYVIYLKIDQESALERIIERITCLNCGHMYNSQDKPKKDYLCDICGHKLVKRFDDNLESFKKRFDTYMTETIPVIEYYRNKKLLYEIDGNLDKFEIFKQIESIIGGI